MLNPIGFYQNRPANKRWTTLVHEDKTECLVCDADLAGFLLKQDLTTMPSQCHRDLPST